MQTATDFAAFDDLIHLSSTELYDCERQLHQQLEQFNNPDFHYQLARICWFRGRFDDFILHISIALFSPELDDRQRFHSYLALTQVYLKPDFLDLKLARESFQFAQKLVQGFTLSTEERPFYAELESRLTILESKRYQNLRAVSTSKPVVSPVKPNETEAAASSSHKKIAAKLSSGHAITAAMEQLKQLIYTALQKVAYRHLSHFENSSDFPLWDKPTFPSASYLQQNPEHPANYCIRTLLRYAKNDASLILQYPNAFIASLVRHADFQNSVSFERHLFLKNEFDFDCSAFKAAHYRQMIQEVALQGLKVTTHKISTVKPQYPKAAPAPVSLSSEILAQLEWPE